MVSLHTPASRWRRAEMKATAPGMNLGNNNDQVAVADKTLGKRSAALGAVSGALEALSYSCPLTVSVVPAQPFLLSSPVGTLRYNHFISFVVLLPLRSSPSEPSTGSQSFESSVSFLDCSFYAPPSPLGESFPQFKCKFLSHPGEHDFALLLTSYTL